MEQLQVAVGVLRQGDQVLIAQRQGHQSHADDWEFPGGKIEKGEDPIVALQREFKEEIGVETEAWRPLITIPWQYESVSVHLRVFISDAFFGEARGQEGQNIRWVPLAELENYTFPEANEGILTALSLPQTMMISGGFDSEHDALLRLEAALKDGVKLVQLRAKEMDKSDFIHLAQKAIAICHQHHAKILINGKPEWMNDLPEADGLQLSSSAIMAVTERPIAADKLLSVSTHSPLEIAKALELGADLILLSPVKETSSHPGMPGVGWSKFAEWVAEVPVPVYALGGMQSQDLDKARENGAQGIAAISGLWPQRF